jgi:2-phosphoglycerate kinase
MLIYLIGGQPRCGKTTVARRLAAATGSAWVQADWLEQGFSAYVPLGEYTPAAHRLDVPPDVPRNTLNDVRYAQYPAETIVAFYRAMAARAWPGLRAIVEYALFDEEDFIIEGYQIDPRDVRRFLDASAGTAANVKAVFLYRADERDILASIKRGGHKNDRVLTKTRREETFARIARMIARYGAAVRADAERVGFPTFNMDGDFEDRAARVIAHLRGYPIPDLHPIVGKEGASGPPPR